MLTLALGQAGLAQEDTVSPFYEARLADFTAYLDARERTATSSAERKAVAAERAACRQRIETARMGYTGLSPEEQAFWDTIKAELDAVLNLWQQSAEAEEGEKLIIRQTAHAAMAAAQRAYVAQMTFAMAQLGMAVCALDAETVQDCTEHFRQELQREYRQDFQSFIFEVPWGLENDPPEEEEHPHKVPTHGSSEEEEGTVDLNAGGEEELLNTPVVPLLVYELAHETALSDAARAAAAGRATRLWQGYLALCAAQVEECFGTERGSALVTGVPLPGAAELSHFAAVQAHVKQLFLAAEQAWAAYVEAVVAAHDPGWKSSEGALAHTPVSAEAQLLRFPLYATHEQFLAFLISPHLQYLEPEPLPDTGMVE